MYLHQRSYCACWAVFTVYSRVLVRSWKKHLFNISGCTKIPVARGNDLKTRHHVTSTAKHAAQTQINNGACPSVKTSAGRPGAKKPTMQTTVSCRGRFAVRMISLCMLSPAEGPVSFRVPHYQETSQNTYTPHTVNGPHEPPPHTPIVPKET